MKNKNKNTYFIKMINTFELELIPLLIIQINHDSNIDYAGFSQAERIL